MTFADVVAQPAALATLLRSLAAERLPHALLLRGPAGVGKLPLAWALAQRVNCLTPTAEGDACGNCAACRKVAQLIHPDVHLLVPYVRPAAGKGSAAAAADEAVVALRPLLIEQPYTPLEAFAEQHGGDNKQLVIPIDAVRELRRRLQLKHFEGQMKVVIVWHAERFNPEAANALLKVLEEPPDRTLFILTVEEPATLLPTIVSRCQGLRLGPLPRPAIEQALVARLGLDPARARAAAALSEGSFTAALASLEGAEAPLAEAVQQWLRLCYGGKLAELQQWSAELAQQPRERQKLVLHYALTQLRDSLAVLAGAPELVVATEAERTFVENFSKTLTPVRLERIVAAVEAGLYHLTRNANAPLALLDLSLDIHRSLRAA